MRNPTLAIVAAAVPVLAAVAAGGVAASAGHDGGTDADSRARTKRSVVPPVRSGRAG